MPKKETAEDTRFRCLILRYELDADERFCGRINDPTFDFAVVNRYLRKILAQIKVLRQNSEQGADVNRRNIVLE
jgi:hypothetical protein